VKVAVYHNLPPGGARRVLSEFLRHSNGENEYDLYTVDLGPFGGTASAPTRAEYHAMHANVSRTFSYPVMGKARARAVAGAPWLVTASHWVARVERRIAADINKRGYDVALVCSCQITHTPSLLEHLDIPSLYYMNEPRRRSFEALYRRRDDQPGIRRLVGTAVDHGRREHDAAAVRAADCVATNSYFSAESIQRSYGRDAVVCYLGIGTASFDLAPDEPPHDDQPSVISVGGLDPMKGHDVVIRSLGLLPPASRPVLDVVYERVHPGYRTTLEGVAEDHGVHLRLHSGITDEELASLYRAASATVAAARLEPFGLVPLESLACGTPVVAVREGGYRETVEHEVNGLLVDRSPIDIAQAIDRTLKVGLDRTRQELRNTVVPKWDWDHAAKRQMELLARTAHDSR